MVAAPLLSPQAAPRVMLGAPSEHNETLIRDPVWWMAKEECNESCLRMLWPFVAGLLNQPRLVEEVNRERIRPLFRCISQLHERTELAEASAQHWKVQWYNAYGQALERQQKVGAVSAGSHAVLADLQEALSAMAQERDRLVAEVRSLHGVMRTNFFERLDREQEHAIRMETFERASHQQFGESVNQHFSILERLQLERSMVQQLQGELKRLAMQLAGSEAVKRHLEEQLQAAEQKALSTRIDAEHRVQDSLLQQRKQVAEQAKEQEKLVILEREKRAFDPTRAEAMAALKAFSALWRCACTPYAGLNARRAEKVMREILVVSTLLQPLSELVQEPLRRALGDRAARELGEALAAEVPGDVQPHIADTADNTRHIHGSWCRWEDAPLPPRQPLHAQNPILMTENR